MALTVNDELLPDRISEIFDGKTVLITGGTGFLGKVLIEKLLRVCPKIGRIIIIAREKKGKEPKQRIEELFNNPLFGPLVAARGMANLLPLVTAVTGEMKDVDLGLSEQDRVICQTANIIVHSAATVRFDVGIKSAVLQNARGTKYMLELAKQCKNLELFIHVSTAYCHPEEKVLEERPYPPPANPHLIIEQVENIDESTSDILTPKLLGSFPNTYAYSKALGEALVEEAMETVPAIILRPSVVIPIYMEPVKGWTDNVNGPIGLLIGAGKGVIRTMYGDENGYADFVPVDCVINAIMTVSWDYLVNGCHRKVMNLTTSEEIRLTWKEVLDLGKDIVIHKVPFETCLWYPGGCITKYRWLHKIRSLLYHWIPAVLVDILIFCLGYKPVLIRVQNRISKSFEVFEYYTNNLWHFKSNELRTMRQKLNKREKTRYTMDADDLDITKYFEEGIMAAKQFILKEKIENIPRARVHLTILWVLDMFFKTIFYIYIGYWLLAVMGWFL